ncbi:hypothetical protein JOE65_001009 [Arthrobacter roseus]|nr:hypothetical protein [Arthrobacter roseus]
MPRGTEPVLPRQLCGVFDPQTALLRGVHEEKTTEGPPGLTAELILLIHENNPAPR